MHERPDDLKILQQTLDRSIEQAGPFLRSSFQMPEHSVTAAQMTGLLQDVVEIAMATVTAKGEPRVGPIGAIFYRGRFHVPTVESAARARHLARRPSVSVTYYEGIDLAIIIHGQAHFVRNGDPEFSEIDGIFVEVMGQSVLEWESGGGLYIRIVPDVIFTFARYPDRVPT